jgi:hypothetical protein
MFARIGLGLATLAAAGAIMAATAAPADARTSFSFSIGTGGFYPFGGPVYYPRTYSYAYAPYYVAPAPVVTYGFSSHVAWCQQHYRSYNAATDTFLGYDGHYHYCVSPY